MGSNLLDFSLKRTSGACPFANGSLEFSLQAGECLWIRGASGVGKSSIVNHLLGLRILPGAEITAAWNPSLKPQERIGILFQQGVLIDALNVYENLALSLRSADQAPKKESIHALLAKVGLEEETATKMPNQLSGGMLRRASLAQILSQEKRLIVLDEPFVGLDIATALGIIEELKRLKAKGWSFILISHQEELVQSLVDKEITLEKDVEKKRDLKPSRAKGRWRFFSRFLSKFVDYFFVSLPLIAFAFLASGFAISMLYANLLNNMGVETFIERLEEKLPYFIKLMMDSKIKEMLNHYLPLIKEQVYAVGLTKTFVLELGPLLTALLLAGRIGGSYSGLVGMMEATKQNDLLKVLGRSPMRWTLLPSFLAALIAAPLLCGIGTWLAIESGGWTGVAVHPPLFPSSGEYWAQVEHTLQAPSHFLANAIVVNIYKSITYIVVIILVAELMTRLRPSLPIRSVPAVITWSVVLASLVIILLDWGFSQFLLFLKEHYPLVSEGQETLLSFQ